MKFTTLILFIIPTFFWSQTKITGHIYSKNQNQKGVTIKNLNTNKVVFSDHFGQFTLFASLNDTIQFDQPAFLTTKIIIKSKQLQAKEISLELKAEIIELDEITVESSQKLDALSLGIIYKTSKKYNKNERRLKTAGDFKPKHLLGLLGGSLPIDPIINKISGRTKKLKKTLNFENENQLFERLKETYDYYLSTDLKVENQDSRYNFYNYLIGQEDLEKKIFTKNIDQNKFNLLELYNKSLQSNY